MKRQATDWQTKQNKVNICKAHIWQCTHVRKYIKNFQSSAVKIQTIQLEKGQRT